MRAYLAAMLVCVCIVLPNVAHANPETEAIELSEQIMSPFCPGVTLHECPSSEAIELRDRIERWFAAGWTEQAVMSELERQYGPSIRARPPGGGTGLPAWIVPIVLTVGGLALAGLLVRRWLKREPDSDEKARLSREESIRLDAELDALRLRR